VPAVGSDDWVQITYTYDPSGRRIAKACDGALGLIIDYLQLIIGSAWLAAF